MKYSIIELFFLRGGECKSVIVSELASRFTRVLCDCYYVTI
jgi:hypothetical protein